MNAAYTTISIPKEVSERLSHIARARGQAKWEVIDEYAKKEEAKRDLKAQEFFGEFRKENKKFAKKYPIKQKLNATKLIDEHYSNYQIPGLDL